LLPPSSIRSLRRGVTPKDINAPSRLQDDTQYTTHDITCEYFLPIDSLKCIIA
jgi:hypothetical protein